MPFSWTNLTPEGNAIGVGIYTEAKSNVQALEIYSGTTAFTWAALPTVGSSIQDTDLTQFKTAVDNYETLRNAKACIPYCNTVCTSHLASHYSPYTATLYACSTHYGSVYTSRNTTYNNPKNCSCGVGS
mgnify:CR=1 FL=1